MPHHGYGNSEDNLQESFSSFYHEGPGNQVLVLKLGDQHFCLLRYFTSLRVLASSSVIVIKHKDQKQLWESKRLFVLQFQVHS